MFKLFNTALFLSLSSLILTDNLNIKAQPFDKFSQLTEAVITILEQCNLGLRNIIVYENSIDASISKAISSVQYPIGILLKSKLVVDEIYNQFSTDINGLIIIKNYHDDLNLLLSSIAYDWSFSGNSTVLLVEKSRRSCREAGFILKVFKMPYISKVYVICMLNSTNVAIYTHDPFGDVKPRFWPKISQEAVYFNKWTWYGRFFRKDRICRNFLFDRAPLKGITVIVAGARANNDPKKSGVRIFSEDLTKNIVADKVEQFEVIKKLLNIKIRYYEWTHVPIRTNGFFGNILVNQNLHIDVLYELYIYRIPSYSLQVSAPVKRVHVTIFSHKQGYKTPSEKIIDFYGIWTLLSLMVVLTMTFVVIWLKKDKNFSFASFEIIRLLINAEILVPINTLPLRIFFSMIFLYFIIIHATFSGNLAKFLTIPVLRTNIESIDDLLDSRIKVIYHSGYNFMSHPKGYLLQNKSIKVGEYQCLDIVKITPNSACITLSSYALDFLHHLTLEKNNQKSIEKLYGTTSESEPMFSSILFRVKFPLAERWNWVILATMETRLFNRADSVITQNYLTDLRKYEKKHEVNFRSICLKDLKFAFLLWISGTFTGLISFIVEILIFRYYRRRIKLIKVKQIKIPLKKSKKRIKVGNCFKVKYKCGFFGN